MVTELLDVFLLKGAWRAIVIDALRMAWFRRKPGKQAGLIFHSDRGSQYASEDFRDLLKDYGITASMSRCGTRRHAKDETIDWLLWYNHSRLHSTLNYVSPMQFEKQWLASQTPQTKP